MDLGILALLSTQIISVWGGLGQMYSGFSLVQFSIKLSFHFLIGIASVILFFLSSKYIKIALPTYILYFFVLEKIWVISPNAPAYFKFLQDIQEMHSNSTVPPETIVDVHPFVYPNVLVYMLFLFALLYVFILRDKLIRET